MLCLHGYSVATIQGTAFNQNTVLLLVFISVWYTVPLYYYQKFSILGIMEVWDFQPINITQNPASHFLFNSLAVLVTLSQAQTCLQFSPKPFQQFMKFYKNFLFLLAE